MDVQTIKDALANELPSESYTEAFRQEYILPPYLSIIKPNTSEVREFLTQWNINPDDVFYDIRQDRIVFTIAHMGIVYDAVGRSLIKANPKWLRYGSSPIPYTHGSGNVLVLVEDAISAYVVSEMLPVIGVALLGTQLTNFHKWFFATYYKHSKYVVALDHDAFPKSIKIVKQLRSYVENVSGLKLKDDLKYANTSDINLLEEMLNE